jgi:hypothetical protein
MWFVTRTAPIPKASKMTSSSFGGNRVGGLLQVIYVLKIPDEVTYESLAVEDWMSVEAGNVTVVVRIIHAMELTARMKKLLRKRRR